MKFPISFCIFSSISVFLTFLFLAGYYLLNPIFAIGLINIVGLVYVFVGAVTISKGIFECLSEKVKESYKNNVPPWFYRFPAAMFLNFSEIQEEGWYHIIEVAKFKERHRDEDPHSPIRGIVWIGLGTILQIISSFLKI